MRDKGLQQRALDGRDPAPDPRKTYTNSFDEPLFVLRYELYKRLIRIFAGFLVVLLLGCFCFVLFPMQYGLGLYFLIMALGAFLPLLLVLRGLIELLLFREIRLYKDRPVKVCYLIGSIETKLENAKLEGTKMRLGSGKCFMKQDANRWFGFLRGIAYDEYVAESGNVRRLNSVLADLTGRKASDFEQSIISWKKLIKEDQSTVRAD